jgi:diguanylate cyclase (GGDEF)-like protein
MPGSLRGQLFAGVSLAFLLLVAGIQAIHVAAARRVMQEQLESHAQDAATSLGLSLGALLLTRNDMALVETVINPVFDRGHYQRIELVALDGRTLLAKELPAAELGVPEWFAALLQLEAPTAGSLVTAGWKQIGSVRVTSYPGFAYRQLWSTTWSTLAWLAALYCAALGAAFAFLKGILLPLDGIERVAVAIGNRDFSAVAGTPRARELRHIAGTINSLSEKVKQAIEAEGARAESLRREAYQDSVTGLLNRRGFSAQFDARMRDAGDVFQGALVLLQFHDFAVFNREVGYERGDSLLESVAAIVAARTGIRGGLCAHWSGVALVMSLPNASAEEARLFADELARAVHAYLADAGYVTRLGFNIGVATFHGASPPLGRLLAAADAAVARAASRGSGLVDHAEADFTKSPLGSSAWRARLEKALSSGSFELCIQPVLGLADRVPIQHEILTRLIDEDGQRVPAADFLPMMVRHGMAPRFDRFVFDRVIGQLARAPQMGEIAVNVSATSAADGDFLRWLEARLLAAPAVARRLVFELAESGSDQDRDHVLTFVAMLRQAGARFALDNFGLHRESLQLMRVLQPAYVKLSRAHTVELRDDEATRFFVASLVRLGAPLDIRVIAQGVEDEEVLPILASAGVAGYQGYLAGPVSVWQT